jgi:glutamate synthase domain-containing protein 2
MLLVQVDKELAVPKRVIILALLGLALGVTLLGLWHGAFFWALALLGPLLLVAIHDLLQTRRTLLRNYPLIGHGRYLVEDFRHQFRQYLIESDRSGEPFTHEQRALVYRRAKAVDDVLPFGTIRDVYAPGYEWVNHAIQATPRLEREPSVTIGGDTCTRPYSASLFNISALSFGSLSSHAILALNGGARKGGFYHNTGEGGISRFHREPGGDLVWEIGSGYFGCRRKDGGFDPERFAEQACSDQLRMIELKLSQGAKPGGGGLLPGVKVTPELAAARGVPVGRDVLSPSAHSEFSNPPELLAFVARLRELAEGRPVGIKFCLGRRVGFMSLVKAMLETGIVPDFVTVDGSEGGTGAATLELANSVGTPLRDALVFVHNTLRGAGLRPQVRVIASGKIISAYDIARSLALGADLCNSARGMMFALGCIQARRCETNRCPTGVATQDPWRVSGLSVPDKSERVYRYHYSTIEHFLELLAALGLRDPSGLQPEIFHFRVDEHRTQNFADLYPRLEPGALLNGAAVPEWYADPWGRASADRFM